MYSEIEDGEAGKAKLFNGRYHLKKELGKG